MWKALLDLGKGEEAYRVAHTALDNWEKECEESYFTFEHFIISSGRGAGWHQFSGLSSPILNWFAAYYKPGKVSTGFEVWLQRDVLMRIIPDIRLNFLLMIRQNLMRRCMIVCMDAGHQYEVFFNGKPVQYRSGHAGMLEITLPATNKTGELVVRTLD